MADQNRCTTCGWILTGTRDSIYAHRMRCVQIRLGELRSSSGSRVTNKQPSPPPSSKEKQAFTISSSPGDIGHSMVTANTQVVDGHASAEYDQEHNFDLGDWDNEDPPTTRNLPPSTSNTKSPSDTSSTPGPTVVDLRRQFSRMDEHIKASMDIFELMVQRGGSKNLFDAVISRFNEFTNGCLPPLYSYYKSREALRQSYGIEPKSHHICSQGCMMYKNEDKSVIKCNHCGSLRFKEDMSTPVSTMIQISLKDQLATFISNDATREKLKYRTTREKSANVMKDIFDGGLYKDLELSTFEGEYDLALGLYTDDFQPYRKASHSMTIVHVVIMNLPPDVRYEDHNMIEVCVAPGPNKPDDLYSFLEPLYNDLQDLCIDGMIVKTDTFEFKLKAHLLFVGGDIPAVTKVAGTQSHSGYYGCRFCTIHGVHIDGRMTFPPMSKKKVLPDVATLSDQECNSTVEKERPKPEIRLSRTFKKKSKQIGQKYKCMFADIPTFHGATFFPIDIMHLLGPGLGKQLWGLMRGKYGKDGCTLYLPKAKLELIGARIAASRNLTPSSFSGDCGDLTFQSGFYRAVDWIHFVLYLVPTIVLEFYDDNATHTALIDLATIYRYAFAREIDADGIACLRNAVKSWTKWLVGQVDQSNISPGVFTVNMHYLTHLCKTIERDGPLPYLAAFNMERAIGQIKKRIRSKRHPGKNVGNVLVELGAVRKRKRQEPTDDVEEEDEEDTIDHENTRLQKRKKDCIFLDTDPNSPEIWGPYSKRSISTMRCKKQLRHFWAWYNKSYKGINIDGDEKIEIGSRLFKDGVTYGGTGRESFVRMNIWVDTSGPNKKEPKQEQRQYIGETKYFFKHSYILSNGTLCQKILAFVELQKLTEGNGLWPYTTGGSAKRYVVVEADDIAGFVGRVKGTSKREYFYWSQKHPHSKKEMPIDYELKFIPHQ